MVIGDDLFLFKDPSAQSKEEMAGDPMPADEAWQEYVSRSLFQSHSVSVCFSTHTSASTSTARSTSTSMSPQALVFIFSVASFNLRNELLHLTPTPSHYADTVCLASSCTTNGDIMVLPTVLSMV